MYMTDLHTHSKNSFDGRDTVEMLCDSAIKKNLSVLGVTDHCEANEYRTTDVKKRMYQSFHDVCDAKDKYWGKLFVSASVELGQPTQDVNASEEVINSYDYDYVLASLHNVTNELDFYYMKEMNIKAIDSLLTRYYNELLDITEWNKFDILGHITYPLRYIEGVFGIKVDMTKYDETIKKLLETVVKNDKIIEINTSGLRQKYNDTFPNEKYLKMYVEAGGKHVSLGSDSHRWEDIGEGITEGAKKAKACGIQNIAIFHKRNRILLPL